MSRHGLLVCFVAAVVSTPVLAQIEPGDYLVVSRTYGTIYAVDPATGLIRGLVSGLELRDQSGYVHGDGLALDGSYRTSLAVTEDGAILARFGKGPANFGLAAIAPASGNRALLPGTDQQIWDEAGGIVALDDGTALSTADDWNGGETAEGKVLQYDLGLGTAMLMTGPGVGDGPVLKLPRGLELLDPNTLLVTETNFEEPPPRAGAGLFTVNLQTGERTFLSRLVPEPFEREVIVNGQPAGTVMLGDDEGGAGPVANLQARSVAVIDGRILVGEAIKLPDQSYNGGILEVDPMTGDRTLLVGCALADDGTGETVIKVVPPGWSDVFIDGPIGLLETDEGRLAFTCLFGPNSIFEYDLVTTELYEVADLGAQLDEAFVDDLRLSGLTICRLHILLGDLNCDGAADFGDINPFVLAVSDPAGYAAAYPDCTIVNGDVNGDGLVNFGDVNPFVALLSDSLWRPASVSDVGPGDNALSRLRPARRPDATSLLRRTTTVSRRATPHRRRRLGGSRGGLVQYAGPAG